MREKRRKAIGKNFKEQIVIVLKQGSKAHRKTRPNKGRKKK